MFNIEYLCYILSIVNNKELYISFWFVSFSMSLTTALTPAADAVDLIIHNL